MITFLMEILQFSIVKSSKSAGLTYCQVNSEILLCCTYSLWYKCKSSVGSAFSPRSKMLSLFFNKFLLDHSEQEAFSTTLKKLRKRNEAGSLSSFNLSTCYDNISRGRFSKFSFWRNLSV